MTDKCSYSIVCRTLQAHHNAQTHSDEFVKSALVSLDKFSVLVGELVTFEVRSLLAHHAHSSSYDGLTKAQACTVTIAFGKAELVIAKHEGVLHHNRP